MGGIEREQSIRQGASGRALRPATWAEVVGQERVVGRIRQLAQRDALAGRAYWLSGQSGTGKTTIARLLAAEVADDFSTQEVDASALTIAALRELERESQISGWGEKGGRAYLVNEERTGSLQRRVIPPIPRHAGAHLPLTSSGPSRRRRKASKGSLRITTTRDHSCPAVCRYPWRAVTWRKRSRSAARKSRSAKGSTAGRWTCTSG